MRKRYYNNLDIFAAQFSRRNVKALQADETGVFVIVGEGIIEKYTDDTVMIREEDSLYPRANEVRNERNAHYRRLIPVGRR